MSKERETAVRLVRENKLRKALVVLEKFNRGDKRADGHTLGLEASISYKFKKYNRAIFQWKKSLNLVDDKTRAVNLHFIALSYYNIGELTEAISFCKKSISLDSSPRNALARLNFCKFAYYLNEYSIVKTEIKKLLALKEYSMEALWLEFEVESKLGNRDLAVNILQRIFIEWDGESISDYSNLFEKSFSLSFVNLAKNIQDKASRGIRCDVEFLLNKARLFFLEKEYLKVIETISRDMLEEVKSRKDIYLTSLTILSKSLDKLERYGDAFNILRIKEAESLKTFQYAERSKVVELYRKHFDKICIELSKEHKENSAPVFMIGFPRSGSTLLENILDTHTEIRTFSESMALFKVREKIKSDFKTNNYVSALNKVKDGYCDELRFLYYKELLGESEHKSDIILIDKMPLHIVHIPLILTLFPAAKFIVNLRHPLDVCLSNLQQNYRIDLETAHFITMSGCIDRYIEVFDFYLFLKKQFHLNVLEVRYEDVVQNLDGEAERVFEFLGVEIQNEYRSFNEYARNKVLNTSSKHQVTEGLYTSSLYRWINYRPQLEQYTAQLKEILVEFGYNTD